MTPRLLPALGAALALVVAVSGCSSDDANAAPTAGQEQQALPSGKKPVTAASGDFKVLVSDYADDGTRRDAHSAEELTVSGRSPVWALKVTSQPVSSDPGKIAEAECAVTAKTDGGTVATGVTGQFGGVIAKGCRVLDGDRKTTWHLAGVRGDKTYLLSFSAPHSERMTRPLIEPVLASWTWLKDA